VSNGKFNVRESPKKGLMPSQIKGYTKFSLWNRINVRALYFPIHFFISAGAHDWKTGYPLQLLNVYDININEYAGLGKNTREVATQFMIDSLLRKEDIAEIPIKKFVETQNLYDVDIYVAMDFFQDPKETTIRTILYLKELILHNLFNIEIMLVIQGKEIPEYRTHFEELLIIATNSQECINCQHNLDCPIEVIFQQTTSAQKKAYHDTHYRVQEQLNQGWTFLFAIGGLIGRTPSIQKSIIEGILDYAIKIIETINFDIFPTTERQIMTDTKKGLLSDTIPYPRIQFHIFGIGTTRPILLTLMKNQRYIQSFDSSAPSLIATKGQIYNKDLGRINTTPNFVKGDKVSEVSTLNMLRGYYNIAMVLYAMESEMRNRVWKENETLVTLHHYIKYAFEKAPPRSKIKPLEEFFEKEEFVSLAPLGHAILKLSDAQKDDSHRIETALQSWVYTYEAQGIMPLSLAILNGLIIFRTLTAKQVIAFYPQIVAPSAAMNIITKPYHISRYWLCEDTPEYLTYLKTKTGSPIPKTIQIREEYLDLVLRYLLKEERLISEYKDQYYYR
jgi:hypothetical protein